MDGRFPDPEVSWRGRSFVRLPKPPKRAGKYHEGRRHAWTSKNLKRIITCCEVRNWISSQLRSEGGFRNSPGWNRSKRISASELKEKTAELRQVEEQRVASLEVETLESEQAEKRECPGR